MTKTLKISRKSRLTAKNVARVAAAFGKTVVVNGREMVIVGFGEENRYPFRAIDLVRQEDVRLAHA